MQITSRTNRSYWATVALGVTIGIVYLIGFAAGGKPLLGVGALAIMVAFSGALVLAGRRSETVRGLLDHRDERISAIDLRARRGHRAVTRASASTWCRSWGASAGHGKRGSVVRSVTVPCSATHTAVASASTSVLADRPAATQSWMAWSSSENASAPHSSTGRPAGSSATGWQ